jgi:hypothetical protein
MATLREQIGNDGLSANEIARLNQEASTAVDERIDPEVAAIVADDELGLRENLLSLKVSTASFDRVALIQQIGGQDLLPSEVRTFLSVDFYNHESKHTDPTEGFEPNFNTMFAFRNTVDDFYVRYLETEHILVDVFALPMSSQTTARPSGVIKIGHAKLPLISIIEGDKSVLA